MSIDSIQILENRVDGILDQHRAVLEERARLARELEEARQSVHDLTAQLQKAEKEREEVKLRVEKILERLNGLDLG